MDDALRIKEAATIVESLRLHHRMSRRELERRSGRARQSLLNALNGRQVAFDAIADMLLVFNHTLTVQPMEAKDGQE